MSGPNYGLPSSISSPTVYMMQTMIVIQKKNINPLLSPNILHKTFVSITGGLHVWAAHQINS